ncbi:hypothetical protein CUPS4066_07255 [Campylobacter upsaliensis]|uniref:Uncharacterized protein n=1 Tax=Campylobacter upsaliensis TaxID=28080 RepID=A0A7U8B402_CAMUP|nr:hypothetical protein [Campylobacter upsaliensis]EAI2137205.1 hypothetical protein [Campylobacter upsaliensis]EAI8783315.1 hypothetical protein [Campylobacter upsaliensis]EAJ1622394.1 hypothetical protein [Campylobacter upsaliensis]EAJ1956701.1 hypothetical protein [Campylobacter upsaliensis]EAJ7019012.1 hypothetical protein [Campylobacter upsaliensis]
MLEIELSIQEFCSIFQIKKHQYYAKKFNTFLHIRYKKRKYKKVILANLDIKNNKIIFKTKNNNTFSKIL